MSTTVLILPPAAAIEASVNELTAQASGDVKRQIAISKAAYDLLVLEPQIARISGAFLVPSTSRGGLIHRVDDVQGCSCEAGRAGRQCRHKVALEIIEAAQTRTMPSLVSAERSAKIEAARAAAAALNECF